MARKKDLGGLAALAGLAYMASRDKARQGSDVPVEDRTGTAIGDTRDYGVDYSEAPQRGRDFMTEKEPAENFSERKPTRSLSTTAAPRARGVSTAGNAGYDTTAMGLGGRDNARDAILARQGRPVANNTEAGMRNYVPRRSAAQQIAGRDDTYNPDVGYRNRAENRDTSDMTYKKGGSVKGWGAARGARKAKIY